MLEGETCISVHTGCRHTARKKRKKRGGREERKGREEDLSDVGKRNV